MNGTDTGQTGQAERRERIATVALQGLADKVPFSPGPEDYQRLAKRAVALADALIAELDLQKA